MSLGLNQKLNILQQSPHDLRSFTMAEIQHDPIEGHWIPSRYNIRATTEDGRLILWNTFLGSMSVFKADQAPHIIALLSRKGTTARKEGIIEYLVDRGFLMREGSNEYRQVQVAVTQQQFRTDRLELILMASEDCNFRCKYCYEEFARGTMLPEVREAIKKNVIKRLPRLAHLQVSWFGGEPLYGWPAIEDLAPFFFETARDNGLGYLGHMTTNGYLLTPEIADKLLKWGVKGFQITVDGLPENHNRSRPTRDGQETFATILENLIALTRRDDFFHVNVRVNFDRENGPHLDQFLEILERDFRADNRFVVSFYPVGRWGGANDESLDVCGTKEIEQLQDQLLAEARVRGLAVGNIKGINYVGSQVCYAARPYNFLIGATGKIMKCTIALDAQDYNVVGHLTPDGDMVLDHDKMALWTEPAFESDGKCQKCVVLPLCQGTHCPMIRIVQDKTPCCGTRSSAKKELREMVEIGTPSVRKIVNGVPSDVS